MECWSEPLLSQGRIGLLVLASGGEVLPKAGLLGPWFLFSPPWSGIKLHLSVTEKSW